MFRFAARSFHTRPVVRQQQSTGSASAASASNAAAPADKLLLRFSSPSTVIYDNQPVDMVIAPAVSGEFGITPKYANTIAQLRPGVVQIINKDQENKRFFVSGGFAVVKDDSTASITVAEAVPLEELDREVIERNLQKFEQEYQNAKDDKEKAMAQIGVEVHTNMKQALDYFK